MKKSSILLFIIIFFLTACSRMNPEYESNLGINNNPDIITEGPDETASPSTPEIPEVPKPNLDTPTPEITPDSAIPSEEIGASIPPLSDIVLSANPVISQNTIFLTEISKDLSEVTIFELSPDGDVVNEVFKASGISYHPYYIKDQLLYLYSDYGLYLYNLYDKSIIAIPESESSFPVGFLSQSPCVVYNNFYKDDLTHQVIIYDYVNKEIIKKYTGYNASISVLDDSIYCLNYQLIDETDRISISSYDAKTDELLERFNLALGDYIYDITEIVPLSKNYFTYSIYDEHEYRYNTSEDYVIATKGNLYSEDIHKEQFDFCFSPDGKIACMAERNWGSLTYIAYGDYTKQEMFQTEYCGSFPIFHNGLICFISDPGFVYAKKGDREFRQISDYAFYILDPKTNELSEIFNTDGFIAHIERH